MCKIGKYYVAERMFDMVPPVPLSSKPSTAHNLNDLTDYTTTMSMTTVITLFYFPETNYKTVSLWLTVC